MNINDLLILRVIGEYAQRKGGRLTATDILWDDVILLIVSAGSSML